MQNNKKILILNILLVVLTLITIGLIYYKICLSKFNFYLIGADKITLEVGNKYNERGFVAKLDKKDLTNKVKIDNDNLDTNKIGNYIIKYKLKIKYLNINKTLKREIKVIDPISPEIKIESEDDIYIDLDTEYNIPNYNATDNVDGDITDKVIIDSNINTKKEGIYRVIFSVKDSSDNETSKKLVIHVEPKYKNSYIDISISNQTLNYYEKNKLVLSSPIVTGLNNSTPTGTYKVLYKSRNVNLRGADYVSFVNFWIAFKGNSYGMHDASWRSSFGGSIYKYNGSHGCVNMPYSKVRDLYNMVAPGTPVYIKN